MSHVSQRSDLTRGARLTRHLLALSRPYKGGIRHCGRRYLAARLGCSTRTVSRYVAELRRAGLIEVAPPRRHRTEAGWRTVGVNGYRLRSPHRLVARSGRSRRDDTRGTPPPSRGCGSPHPAPDPGRAEFRPPDIPDQSDGLTAGDYKAGLAAARAALRAARPRRPR